MTDTISDTINTAETYKPKPEMEVLCMADIEMRPIDWLWPDYIACGKLTVIAGNPGLGKSQFTACLAAILTTGGYWPKSNDKAQIGSIVILSAEDDPADTIKPRLVAAGADLKRCHVVQAVNLAPQDGVAAQRAFDLTQDVERLARVVETLGNVRALVIDPISAYQGDSNSNNNAETRSLLLPLIKMAEKYGVAVVVLTHLNKSENQDIIGRVIGSIGLVAAARSAFAVVKDTKDPAIRYFVPLKSNIGNDEDGFAYEIEGVELPGGINTSRIQWRPELVKAQDILYPTPEVKPTATNGAASFLREFLADGPKLKSEIEEQGEGAGYSKSALQRAKKRLGITHRKLGMDGGWEWALLSEGLATKNAAEGTEGTEETEDGNNSGVAASEIFGKKPDQPS